MIDTLAVAQYRSLRQLIVPLGRLNLITGPNASGKSNLYRALRLLAETAQGGVIAALAREGGLGSTLWAGTASPRSLRSRDLPVQGGPRKEPVSLRLGFAGAGMSYAIDLGLPPPSESQFSNDPEIKRECIWAGPVLRPASLLVDRRGPLVRIKEGRSWEILTQDLASFDSMLTQIADPVRAPEVLALRETIRSWRFYDQFRADADAPAREARLGTRTPVLSHDGRDLAAALQTIREIGDGPALDAAIDDAFPGARLTVWNDNGRFELELHQDGLLRPLTAAELSDGTLRGLLWIAALLTPRPPALMVLNEPETSLHQDLMPALARLIRHAARESQVWVVSHAARLIAALEKDPDCQSITLEKDQGETRIAGQGLLDQPPWHWPER